MSLPLLVVTVGTDHHPFGRLIEWVDRWLEQHDGEVDAVVQHGTAPAPKRGRSSAFLEHAQFTTLAASAQIVVCHGGPATIAECRRLGHLPIVVPRRADLGEHVDNHQMLFAGRLSVKGMVRVPRTEEEFVALMDAGLADPMAYELPVEGEPPVAASVRRFGELVAALQPRG